MQAGRAPDFARDSGDAGGDFKSRLELGRNYGFVKLKPMKIVEYKTASANTIATLDHNVNQLLRVGFQPFGSPYFIGATEGNADSPICQAVVKYEQIERQAIPTPIYKT